MSAALEDLSLLAFELEMEWDDSESHCAILCCRVAVEPPTQRSCRESWCPHLIPSDRETTASPTSIDLTAAWMRGAPKAKAPQSADTRRADASTHEYAHVSVGGYQKSSSLQGGKQTSRIHQALCWMSSQGATSKTHT